MPYKQVFCIPNAGRSEVQFYYYKFVKSKLDIVKFKDGEKMHWNGDQAVLYMTYDEYRTQEDRETQEEVDNLNLLKYTSPFTQRRINKLNSRIHEIKNDKRPGDFEAWKNFKDVYRRKKAKTGFTWMDKSKVYTELQNL